MAGAKEKLVVTLSGTHPPNEVAEQLQRNGFQVEGILEAIGVITGSGNEEEVERLRAVPGIADVSKDHGVDIGPPGSSDTW